jgi:GxxExxY protein
LQLPELTESIGRRVIGCAMTVHRLLGPGYREAICVRALCLELDEQGLKFEREKKILVPYKRWQIDGHRLDLIIEGCLVVELKAIPQLREIHRMQVLSYLKATGLRLGYVMNFNTEILQHGIKRVVL